MSSLVALIIGAGANVGRSHQYKVALGSRNPDVEALKKDGFLPRQGRRDQAEQRRASVQGQCLTTLAPPNVVIFNAVVFKQPKVASDPPSTAIANSIYAAAQQFRSLTPETRFHFAFFVSDEGDYPAYSDFLKSGPAHAEAYWDLISSEKPEGWDYRFTLNGKKYFEAVVFQ
ncbi:hypothetical protein F5146DRAFT_1102352 [Armillaria mellea]|nr:hypothetical protein F5146DRAFT_1102352 [Armillaria mellea]